ncbi:hypothetical protein MAIT1_03886 [Magnetofaba australis IT-1]|uniref:Uncharacterized protein n=1 Tax=Magnetofaba australis IT-1 TaxID=1434232 RepID=A0A1Y2K8W0_9PROT|nr:hypothetical protein MAIT1_03886 [Magnetofaba australis IT-1]
MGLLGARGTRRADEYTGQNNDSYEQSGFHTLCPPEQNGSLQYATIPRVGTATAQCAPKRRKLPAAIAKWRRFSHHVAFKPASVAQPLPPLRPQRPCPKHE